MNVILNVDEVQAVLARVTGAVLDHVELSAEGAQAIREWRKHRSPGTKETDEFTLLFNEAIGNHIDERTNRMLRLKGGRYVTEKEARA
mgnify:CR=1 FL=1